MSKRPLEEEETKEQEGGRKSEGFPFKNPSFQHSNVSGSRKRPWKTLKQLLAAEAALDWPEVDWRAPPPPSSPPPPPRRR